MIKQRKKYEKGITLIALVITIIILLILAGVTINILFNDGIAKNAQTAVDKYSEESAKEKINLAILDYKMGVIEGEGKDLQDYLDKIEGTILAEDEDSYTIELDGYEFIVKKQNYEIISNGPITGEKPTINNIKVIPSENKKSVEIKITASAVKGGALTVKVNGNIATPNGDGTYSITVNKNGKYSIIVEESEIRRKASGNAEVIEIVEEIIVLNNINGTANAKVGDGDFSYSNPVVPVGFRTSSEGASWADSNNDGIVDGWNDGLVIEDEDENQFVWVPVHDDVTVNGKTIQKVEYKKWDGSVTNEKVNECSNASLPSKVTSTWGQNEQSQITTYGGFYIARYEAGIPSTLTEAIGDVYKRNVTGTPVSKKNQVPWNDLSWTNARDNAVSMYNDSNFIQSGLVTGTMWDTTMQWLENDGVNVQTDSSAWGNYKDAEVTGITEYSENHGKSWISTSSTTKGTSKVWLLKTGNSEYTNRKNIYDLAGNLREWTNEAISFRYATRGGSEGILHSNFPAMKRAELHPTSNDESVGFRVCLYIK